MLALLLAAFSPKLELLGVSTVHGNASIEDTTANAARSLVAFNAPESVHVHPGRACGILRSTATYASSVHGTDGLGGVRGLPDASDPRVQQRVLDATTHSAVEGIRTACLQVLKREDRLTLLVTGKPNLAS